MRYIDKTFGKGRILPGGYDSFYPKDFTAANNTALVRLFTEEQFPWAFYSMLFYQDERHQFLAKEKMLDDIEYLNDHIQGPFVCGR